MPNWDTSKTTHKPIESLMIRIDDGRVVVFDYSQNDERRDLIVFLEAMGFKVNIQTESWCG